MSAQLDNPKQVQAWITELLDRRRADIVEAWEASYDPSERERLHVAIHETEALRDAVERAIRDAGDGDTSPG